MKNILVPCDFSPASHEAFKFAVKIAQQGKGKIHVLHVIDITALHGSPNLAQSYVFNLNFLKEVEEEADKKFQNLWQQNAPLTLPVFFRHKVSSLLPAVASAIAEYGIDLVVMGMHDETKGGWDSNTNRMIQHSPVPVCAVRKEPKPIRNMVVPMLPDQPDAHFYAELKKLQSFFGASLHFLWVNTPLIFKSDRNAQDDLMQFATREHFKNYFIHVRSDYHAQEGIYRFAKEIDGDLIALRTHAWKGFVHFITGSVAEDIAGHVDLPVWTCTAR
jgi:nucleotide-binding universal stress UspA family protein